MFTRATECVRCVLVSWEFAFVLAVMGATVAYPSLPQVIGTKALHGDANFFSWLLAVPCALLAWSAVQAWKILGPATAEQNAKLRSWPAYWRLKLRTFIGMFWIVLSCGLALAVWLFKSDLSEVAIGASILILILVPLLSSASLWLAAVTVREIVEK